jgi:hypothetical protein
MSLCVRVANLNFQPYLQELCMYAQEHSIEFDAYQYK